MTDLDTNLVALTEQIADWRTDNLEIQLAERAVYNVLLSGGTSKNGHRYSEMALREAAVLYDQKPVFLDHAANLAKPYDRSMRDLAGTISEPKYVDGRIQGDIRVLDTEAGRTLLALMESDTPAMGMSHVILARKSADGMLVEKIHDVISVDAVVFPATTAGFREQLTTEQAEELETQLAEARQEMSRATAERDELRRRCETFAAEAERRDIDVQLAAAGLPEFAVTDSFRERLRLTSDSQTRSRLIAEHRQLVLRCRQRSPCSRPRDGQEDPTHDRLTRQFIQAVKGMQGRTFGAGR
jgi:hypothetical protein